MAIYVQCEGGSGVAQISLHCLDVVPGADRGDCVGVTQVVETGIGTTHGRNDTLVLAVDCWLCQVCTELVGKDQTFRILPGAANAGTAVANIVKTMTKQSNRDVIRLFMTKLLL